MRRSSINRTAVASRKLSKEISAARTWPSTTMATPLVLLDGVT